MAKRGGNGLLRNDRALSPLFHSLPKGARGLGGRVGKKMISFTVPQAEAPGHGFRNPHALFTGESHMLIAMSTTKYENNR